MLMRRAQSSVALLALFSAVAPVFLFSAGALAEKEKQTPEAAEKAEFYEKQVLPILEANCIKCHGGRKKIKGNFRLTSRKALLRGGDIGPSIDVDNLEKSLLLEMISYKDDERQMPPAGKLDDDDIETLTIWVKMGAPFSGREEADDEPEEVVDREKLKDWWAYKKLERPALPKVKDDSWVSNPIDAFILAKLEENGLTPSKPADRVALIRRAYYDLIGLPPAPAEIEAFLNDKSPKAYENVIDHLLGLPQYGEKWGRHWLDLVRYAETNGYERDSTKPFAWRYRDYVINALNDDKPYDQFIKEQIAGDELDEVTADSISATGFYRLGIWNDEPADRKLAKYDLLDGIISTTGSVMMGMSIGCARCHDHKKDPIPQTDYYRMLAFFQNVSDYRDRNTREVMDAEQAKIVEERRRKKAEEEGQIYGKIFSLEQEFKLALATKKKDVKLSQSASQDLVDLSYKFYRDTWDKLPEFDLLKHETAGRIAGNHLTLDPASRKHAIGLVFEGKLQVPQDGEYTFFVKSSDGVRLILDGKKVLERDGRGSHEAAEKVALKAGLRGVRLEYFNNESEPKLEVEWSGSAIERRSLTVRSELKGLVEILPDARKGSRDVIYTTKRPPKEWNRLEYNARVKPWRRGKSGLGRAGTPKAVIGSKWETNEIWVRWEFESSGAPSRLFLDIHHDEDAQVFINGQQVNHLKGHTGDYKRVELDANARRTIKKGKNVLAIYCRQTGGGQYIDAGLTGQFDGASLADLLREHGGEVLGEEKTKTYFSLVSKLQKSRQTKIEDAQVKYKTLAVAERGNSKTHVFGRGSPHIVGKEVFAGYPEVLGGGKATITERADKSTSGKRRVFAEWLVSEENSLTSRAIANRLWQFHFGRGIVRTPNDFGRLGELPTHPKLLDWLAVEIRERKWSLKAMHKLMMTSSAYRMSSADVAAGLEKDPANHLFWRFDLRLLTAEEIRDSILEVCGTLNLKQGGPSFYPEVPRDVLQTASRPGAAYRKSSLEERNRRAVYIFIKRSLIPPMLSTHDLADTDSSCAVRFTTTVPTQALTMLNSKFLNEQAGVFAARLKNEGGSDIAKRIRMGLELVCGRTPSDKEVATSIEMVKDFQKEGLSEDDAMKYFALLALNLNEFMYLD